MATNEEIAKEYDFSGGNVDYMSKVDFIASLDKARADTTERIDALLGEMEKEPPIKERKRNSYDIGYLVALNEARLRIRKIFKVD